MQERLRKATQLQYESVELCDRLTGYKIIFEDALTTWFTAMSGSGISGIVKKRKSSETGIVLEIFGWQVELRTKTVAYGGEIGDIALLLDFVHAGDDQDVSVYKAWINKDGWLGDSHGTFSRHQFKAPSAIETLMQMAALGIYESPLMQVGIGKPQPKGCMEIF
ncbi:hypothetical protein [Chromobacterium vaccinii]|uniref:Uncharacterized protein n=1 Tax=Chromobacterium vaccinii TaxID=1108595 RepID=A0A1D9LC37_9NEIS|nr:hypothetical protein [Chromobacterium vaccinii]AOZ48829.1 hypothetical protein BKX93_01675 [Chromobacterium vaccinii]